MIDESWHAKQREAPNYHQNSSRSMPSWMSSSSSVSSSSSPSNISIWVEHDPLTWQNNVDAINQMSLKLHRSLTMFVFLDTSLKHVWKQASHEEPMSCLSMYKGEDVQIPHIVPWKILQLDCAIQFAKWVHHFILYKIFSLLLWWHEPRMNWVLMMERSSKFV